jgi:KDO2-lipid IV(A) lauroyltransferase
LTWLLHSLSWIFGKLSLRGAQNAGAGIGFLAYLFSPRRREVDLRISECLGVDTSEARKIQKRMYRNLGFTVAEFLRFPYMSADEVRGLIEYEGTGRLPTDEKGFIAMVGHTGNWELMAAGTGFLDPPVHLNLLVKPIKPDSLNDWINKVRSCSGNTVHDRRGASKEIFRVLKRGENLAFVLDQNARRHWGMFVEFFGKPACTYAALAQLAARSGSPVFPVLCRRDPETRKLRVSIGQEVPGPRDRSEEELRRVTQECTYRLEEFIRAYPDQWIWMHRRWKTKALPEEGV